MLRCRVAPHLLWTRDVRLNGRPAGGRRDAARTTVNITYFAGPTGLLVPLWQLRASGTAPPLSSPLALRSCSSRRMHNISSTRLDSIRRHISRINMCGIETLPTLHYTALKYILCIQSDCSAVSQSVSREFHLFFFSFISFAKDFSIINLSLLYCTALSSCSINNKWEELQ